MTGGGECEHLESPLLLVTRATHVPLYLCMLVVKQWWLPEEGKMTRGNGEREGKEGQAGV